MSIKDALNYTVKTNSTGLKRPSMSSEEDMDKRLAEMRKNNMRKAPGGVGSSTHATKPVKSATRSAVKTRPVVKEKPEKAPEPDVDVDEFAAPPAKVRPVKEKAVKEKPVKEKPVKEKPAKEKRGFFGRKKNIPEETEEVLEEDDGDIIFDDVDDASDSSGDLFSKEDMMSSMDDVLDEEDKEDKEDKEEDSDIDSIRDIKDIEVKNIDEGRLDQLERDDEDKDMKIFKPRHESGRFENPRFKGPGPDLSRLAQDSGEADELFEEAEKKAPEEDNDIKDLFDEDIKEESPVEENKAETEEPAPENADSDLKDSDDDRSKDRKFMHDRNKKDMKKSLRKSDIFDSDENDEGVSLPDKKAEEAPDSAIAEADRTSVLRKEIERNASGRVPQEEIGAAAAAAPVKREAGAPIPRNAAARRRPMTAGQSAAPVGGPVRPEEGGNVPGGPEGRNANARHPVQKRVPPQQPQQPQNPGQPAQGAQGARPQGTPGQNPTQGARARGAQGQNPTQGARPVRSGGVLRPERQTLKTLPDNIENTAILSATKQKKAVPDRQSAVERKKEAGRREFESRRRNLNEEDFKESSFPLQIISYVAVAIIVIIALICAFRGIEFNTLSPLVLGIISVIMVVMGIFLGMIPSFITLIIAAAALVAGALTGFFSEVVSALVVLLATVTALKGRKG